MSDITFSLGGPPDARYSHASVVKNTGDESEVIGTIFYDQIHRKFWGIEQQTNDTPYVGTPAQALEDVATAHLARRHAEKIVQRAYATAARFEREFQRVQKEALAQGRHVHRLKSVTEAEARFEGAIAVLGDVLLEAGVGVAGYNLSSPSNDLTRARLTQWIEQNANHSPE